MHPDQAPGIDTIFARLWGRLCQRFAAKPAHESACDRRWPASSSKTWRVVDLETKAMGPHPGLAVTSHEVKVPAWPGFSKTGAASDSDTG